MMTIFLPFSKRNVLFTRTKWEKHYLTHINNSRAQSPFYYICDSYYYNLAAAAVTHFTPLLEA